MPTVIYTSVSRISVYLTLPSRRLRLVSYGPWVGSFFSLQPHCCRHPRVRLPWSPHWFASILPPASSVSSSFVVFPARLHDSSFPWWYRLCFLLLRLLTLLLALCVVLIFSACPHGSSLGLPLSLVLHASSCTLSWTYSVSCFSLKSVTLPMLSLLWLSSFSLHLSHCQTTLPTSYLSSSLTSLNSHTPSFVPLFSPPFSSATTDSMIRSSPLAYPR